MNKISYLEALENLGLRQGYLDYLVISSGLSFPYVDEFKYITKEEAIKIKDKLCHSDVKDLEHISAACAPNRELPTNSTIYLTENNFSDNCKELIKLGIKESDFETAQKIEICYHEAAHSEHFGRGIDGFNFKEFKLETKEGRWLFLIASELDAHRKHVQLLVSIKTNSFYLQQYQKNLVKDFFRYINLLPSLAKKGFDEKLARKIFDRYNHLKFRESGLLDLTDIFKTHQFCFDPSFFHGSYK